MNEIVSSGRSVEEAVDEGLKILGVARDEVRVEVLDEGTKGLFGLLGGRLARVRLTVAGNATGAAAAAGAVRVATEGGGMAERVRSVTGEVETSRPERMDREDEKEVAKGDAGAGEGEKEIVSVAVRTEKTEVAQQFLAGLVEKMGVSGEVITRTDGEYVTLEVAGRKLGILIGRRGQTLDAIQYLVNVAANLDGRNWVRFIVDAEEYRKRREETLRRLAFRVADKAKAYRRRQVLEPMTPQERRIIHTTLQDDPDVTTFSEGEEPYRRVVVGLREERTARSEGTMRSEGALRAEGTLRAERADHTGAARYGYGRRRDDDDDSV